MRILSVKISKIVSASGIDDLKMTGLQDTVILVGKNGSGKTRILNTIQKTLSIKPSHESVDESTRFIQDRRNLIKKTEDDIISLQSQIEFDKSNSELLLEEISSKKQIIQSIEEDINNHLQIVDWDLIDVSFDNEDRVIEPPISIVPKNLDIYSYYKVSQIENRENAGKISSMSSEDLAAGTIPYIKLIQDNFIYSSANEKTPNEEREAFRTSYDSLKRIVKDFLQTTLEMTDKGEPMIFGLPISQAKLSDGQIILLQYCALFHSKGSNIQNLVLFMDEPENHLHPSVIIEVLERLHSVVSNGQIWIATHSISIISNFDLNNLWFVDEGKVSYSGRVPERVITSLLGDEERKGRLRSFVHMPAVLAMTQYAFECLKYPLAVLTNEKDPQGAQIRDELSKLSQQGKKLKALDFGAGKGRLLDNFIQNSLDNNIQLSEWLNYVAYDPFTDDKEECRHVIDTVFENAESRYYNSLSSLKGAHDLGSFDVVIMCNVLHEIDPDDWLDIFKDLKSLLNDQGALLIVEDNLMPIGEKAYANGFIVLNTVALKSLFRISSEDINIVSSDLRKDERLMAHLIPKEHLDKVDGESRMSALIEVKKTAKERIKSLRDENETSYRAGLKHGFWVQQYTNSSLALDVFKK